MGVNPMDAINVASSLVPMVSGLAQGYQLRHDPLLDAVGRQGIQRYNEILQNNPYGDPMSGWGGMFGYNQDGSPVGFGQAQAGAMGQMLGYQGANQAMQNYSALAGAQGPQLQDATAGMRGLLGYDATPQQYQVGMPFQPAYSNPNVPINAGAGGQGNPQGESPYQLDRNLGTPRFDWMDRIMQPSSGGQTPGGGQQPQGGPTWTRPGNSNAYGGSFNKVGEGQAQQFQQMPRDASRMPAQGTSGQSMRQPTGYTPMQPNAPAQGGGAPQSMRQGPNPMQQLFNAPQAYTPQFQQQLYSQGKANIDAESQAMQRQMRTQAGTSGMMDSGAYRGAQYQAGQDRLSALRQLNTDIGTRAAETNFGNLLQTAGLQGGMEQALGQLQLGQNQQQIGAYQSGVENMGRIIDQQYNMGNNAQQQQMALWNQLSNLGRQGMQLPQDYLARIEQRQFNRLAPTSTAAGPTYVGNQGGGDGGSSGLGQALGQAAGYTMANWSPWGN